MSDARNPESGPFRTCGSCQHAWESWSDFVLDGRLRLLGLQASIEWPHANLFIFEHACGSTVSVLATRLRHLLGKPAPDPSPHWFFGSEDCRRHCTNVQDMTNCDRPCANARDRRVLELLIQIKVEGCLPDHLAGPRL
jgi:hypothetical protein